jgi:GTP-binding protein
VSGFVDEAQIHAKAGDGGAGCVAFRREAHVSRGGPDGGDGGPGGDVWLVADHNQASLLGFRDHPFRRAADGTHGSGQRRHGARGADQEVPVPVGTVVRDAEGTVLADLAAVGDRLRAAAGGQGGQGNARFLSNRRRAPAFAEQGERGEERWLNLELRLAADVALVGLPNVGKSTLIATVSAARPKIADYPFTTLEPHLGVVRVGRRRARPGEEVEFVMADVPGLVEGAAEGRGLGHRFLRHVERARVLLFLCDLADPSGQTPAEQLAVLRRELGRYRPELLSRPSLVVGSRADLVPGSPLPDGLALSLSAATGKGVPQLLERLALLVTEAREAEIDEGSRREPVVHRPAPEGLAVEPRGPGCWALTGRAAERAVRFSDLEDEGAQEEAMRRLRRLGVDRALSRAGARDGDVVEVGEASFTWYRDPADAPAPAAGRRRPR